MRDLSSLGLRVRNGRLSLLDQSLLPSREDWLLCDDVDDLIGHIRALRVRGAPMIALAAALMVAHRAAAGDERNAVADAIERLRGSRPTAVNLMHAMDRMRECLAAEDWRHRLATIAEALFEEDRVLCKAIADNGAPLIADGDRVLTHCNTGGLATAGIGTALGVLRRAHAQGKRLHVWVGETRPLLQGGRLTAWELGHFGIPYRLIADSAAAALMAAGEVDKVIVGADRIAANGDVANKVGTYGLAVLARHHGIPFYVAAPHTTVDVACPSGAGIPIEQRAADELRGAAGPAGRIDWSPPDAPVYNPAFDVTPAALISGWVLDTGLLDPAAVQGGALR